jgi:hypothetical protein
VNIWSNDMLRNAFLSLSLVGFVDVKAYRLSAALLFWKVTLPSDSLSASKSGLLLGRPMNGSGSQSAPFHPHHSRPCFHRCVLRIASFPQKETCDSCRSFR